MIRIPPELLAHNQWVLWRKAETNGRTTKIPISPWSGKAAACNKPQTWSTYRHVRYAMRRYSSDGVGFVFTESDPFCGIDLDQCRATNGAITPEALEFIKPFDSYAELSPSGAGAHILIKGKLRGKEDGQARSRCTDFGRYFTVNGKHIRGTPLAIHSRRAVLDELTTKFSLPAILVPRTVLPASPDTSDDEVLERAKNARSGERFRRLWAGETSDYGNDHSRADLALCRILAFWCGGESRRIDRLFRRSGLMREKWNRRTGDTAYGVLTLRAALHEWQNR